MSLDLKTALAAIQTPELIREDAIIPDAFPECMDSTYRAGYDWLYQYERDIAAFLAPWLKPYRYDLIGEKGILCEALSNAFCHGHAKDPRKVMALKVYLGKRGLLVQVKDSGKGFNVQRVIQSYHQKKMYYHTAGNGIHLMAASKVFGIFYDACGWAFHLLYIFDHNFEGLEKVQVNPRPVSSIF